MPESRDTGAILAIDELRTEFRLKNRTYKAVGGVTLEVKPGECLGIIGESGSGKSVTALSVMGLVASPPGVIAGGSVRYRGDDLVGAPYETLRRLRGDRVAYIFQDPLSTLHPLYKVGQQLGEAIRCHHDPEQATLKPLLPHVVHLADSACMMLGQGIGSDGLAYEVCPSTLEALEFTPERMMELMDDIAPMLAADSFGIE